MVVPPNAALDPVDVLVGGAEVAALCPALAVAMDDEPPETAPDTVAAGPAPVRM